jgi:hypothetical protein
MSEWQQVDDFLRVIHPRHEENVVTTPQMNSFKQSWGVHRLSNGQKTETETDWAPKKA